MSRNLLDVLGEEDRKYFIQDMTALLRDSQQRKLLWFVLELCGMYDVPDPSLNASVKDHMNGARNVGLQIIRLLDEIDVTTYPLMLLEKAQSAKSEVKPNSQAEGEDDDQNA